MNQVQTVLNDLQDRDDNIYRVIFEAEPIPNSVRQAGFGGSDRYKDLEGYDLILSCVDNMETRKLIFEFCHKNNKDYLDFRSEGRMVMAFQKTNLKDDLETLDVTDKNSGSCQREYDTERAIIQKSYLISSAIAIQMLLNYLRGEKNYKILMRI